jgi:uracil-DNA glycosylase
VELKAKDWKELLKEEFSKDYYLQLVAFLEKERNQFTVMPQDMDVFKALEITPYHQVKVVLLGQDPYHNEGQAHGLSFSVPDGQKIPPSLLNLFKELKKDYQFDIPKNGNLTAWAKQGVLLLNTLLTVRLHEPCSHENHGWEQFTDAVIDKLLERNDPVVFVLLGQKAKAKIKRIKDHHDQHVFIEAAHPSPMAYRHFSNSHIFLKINQALLNLKKQPIDFRLDN